MAEIGTPATPDELCKNHPELLPELRRRISALASMDVRMHGVASEVRTTASFAPGEDAGETEICKDLAGRYRAIEDHQRELADKYNGLGAILIELQQYDEARKHLGDSLTIWEPLVGDHPSAVNIIGQAGAVLNMGVLLRNQGDAEGSFEWCDRAVRLLEPLYEHGAAASQFMRNSLGSRAQALHLLERYGEAVKDWDLAYKLSPAPERPGISIWRAASQAQAGATRDAVEAIRQVMQHSRMQWSDHYNCACIYAIVSDKVDEQQSEYAQLAVEQLRLAARAGFRDVQHLRSDSDLASLQHREDFKALLVEIERSPVQ